LQVIFFGKKPLAQQLTFYQLRSSTVDNPPNPFPAYRLDLICGIMPVFDGAVQGVDMIILDRYLKAVL
jgi:hypothetical protein